MTTLTNPSGFFSHVRAELFAGGMSQSQIDGINAIVAAWPAESDLRFVADALATAYHETARTMQPIEEYGKGRGRAYGHPTGPWHVVYDGRGYEQMTWEENYRHATRRLHERGVLAPDLDIERNPELALRPDIAAAVMVYGMTEGWFTGKKLADYFAEKSDWVNARRVINGLDHAAQIGAYGVHFFLALKA